MRSVPRRPTPDRPCRACRAYGIAAVAGGNVADGRIHVTGSDPRLLRQRLSTVLAGVDDLRVEWEATAELACYHYDRRRHAGEDDPLLTRTASPALRR